MFVEPVSSNSRVQKALIADGQDLHYFYLASLSDDEKSMQDYLGFIQNMNNS